MHSAVRFSSILGLLLVVVTSYNLDHGIIIFMSDAAFKAHEQGEMYKYFVLAISLAISLIWPTLTIKRIISIKRDSHFEIVFWRRIAIGLGGATLILTVTTIWISFHQASM